ncbi:hypothetical protein C8F04DRAFT_1291733 [Mycena alexandri]|uniref:Uncharacterized protein n=1 Tax=Mycena alexandri TaxID=1745969 RepID=A0AAD6SJC0_9AGAR|nr:hypothetical protein C8F04DRAFT_1291733 [Mycena alexandri]
MIRRDGEGLVQSEAGKGREIGGEAHPQLLSDGSRPSRVPLLVMRDVCDAAQVTIIPVEARPRCKKAPKWGRTSYNEYFIVYDAHRDGGKRRWQCNVLQRVPWRPMKSGDETWSALQDYGGFGRAGTRVATGRGGGLLVAIQTEFVPFGVHVAGEVQGKRSRYGRIAHRDKAPSILHFRHAVPARRTHDGQMGNRDWPDNHGTPRPQQTQPRKNSVHLRRTQLISSLVPPAKSTSRLSKGSTSTTSPPTSHLPPRVHTPTPRARHPFPCGSKPQPAQGRSASPPPHILRQLIEIGFSIPQSPAVLDVYRDGMRDVQAAIDARRVPFVLTQLIEGRDIERVGRRTWDLSSGYDLDGGAFSSFSELYVVYDFANTSATSGGKPVEKSGRNTQMKCRKALQWSALKRSNGAPPARRGRAGYAQKHSS